MNESFDIRTTTDSPRFGTDVGKKSLTNLLYLIGSNHNNSTNCPDIVDYFLKEVVEVKDEDDVSQCNWDSSVESSDSDIDEWWDTGILICSKDQKHIKFRFKDERDMLSSAERYAVVVEWSDFNGNYQDFKWREMTYKQYWVFLMLSNLNPDDDNYQFEYYGTTYFGKNLCLMLKYRGVLYVLGFLDFICKRV